MVPNSETNHTFSAEPQPAATASKAQWRAWAKNIRADEPIESLSTRLCNRLKQHHRFQQLTETDHLLLYAPTHGEFNPQPLQNNFEGNVYLPRIIPPSPHRSSADNAMAFHHVTPAIELTPHPIYTMPEPPADAPLFSPSTLHAPATCLVILPALTTDAHGYRIGYGGGYYDRFLASLMPYTQHLNLWTVILMSDKRHVAQLPTERYDKAVDTIITPTQIIDQYPTSVVSTMTNT